MEMYSSGFQDDTSAYLRKMAAASQIDIIAERNRLFSLINGEAFFALKFWPSWIKQTFWNKPLSDKQTFKIMLFFIGNGCSPTVSCQWIITSLNTLSNTKQQKRFQQMMWILKNLELRKSTWYYYDLIHKRYVFLNGTF